MHALRSLLKRHRGWFALLLTCTLVVRVCVPAGFMPMMHNGAFSLMWCPGMAAAAPMAGMADMHGGKSDGKHHGAPQSQCPFAAAGLGALRSPDFAVLLAAIAFAYLLVSRRVAPLLLLPAGRLRPPLRAPPASC